VSGVHLRLLATLRTAYVSGPVEVDQRLVENFCDPSLWQATVSRTVDIDGHDLDSMEEENNTRKN